MQRKALSPLWENAKQALRGNENWGQPELNARVTSGAAFSVCAELCILAAICVARPKTSLGHEWPQGAFCRSAPNASILPDGI